MGSAGIQSASTVSPESSVRTACGISLTDATGRGTRATRSRPAALLASSTWRPLFSGLKTTPMRVPRGFTIRKAAIWFLTGMAKATPVRPGAGTSPSFAGSCTMQNTSGVSGRIARAAWAARFPMATTMHAAGP